MSRRGWIRIRIWLMVMTISADVAESESVYRVSGFLPYGVLQ